MSRKEYLEQKLGEKLSMDDFKSIDLVYTWNLKVTLDDIVNVYHSEGLAGIARLMPEALSTLRCFALCFKEVQNAKGRI